MTEKGNSRNPVIDSFRGLIMILMALDHASYFVIGVHFYEGFNYMDTSYNILAFTTRFVSHLCAPGFFFALGYGAYRKYLKGPNMRINLIIRGFFLIMLQFTLENLAWNLNEKMSLTYVGVLFVLGTTLIFIALLIDILKDYGHVLGILIIILTQVSITDSSFVLTQNALLRFLFVPGQFNSFYILYVVAPWFGVASIGVYFSNKKSIPYFSNAVYLLIIFIAVRITGVFGNTNPYDTGLISFFNVTKYPPSIAFLSLTMGLNFLIMAALDHFRIDNISNILKVYGKSALSFYILHLYVYLLIGRFINTDNYLVLYITWLIGVAILYYPCKYFNIRYIKKKWLN